mgnify:CR=1 FL=1
MHQTLFWSSLEILQILLVQMVGKSRLQFLFQALMEEKRNEQFVLFFPATRLINKERIVNFKKCDPPLGYKQSLFRT